MHNFHGSHFPRKVQAKGSALLLTLLVVSLLMVLVLGFSVFVRMEQRQLTARQQVFEARANAHLGLQIALGELQVAAGPDRRSVARANLMHNHAGVGVLSSASLDALTASQDTRSLWTGVSHSDGFSNISSSPQPVVWLVSGLDRSMNPAQQLSGGPSDPVNMLTLRETTSPGSPVAVTLRAGKVPILEPDNALRGTYAWVIDDETQKAKLAPSVDTRNQAPAERLASQRSVLPGFFNLYETTGLSAPQKDIFRAVKPSDLVLGTSGDAEIINDRFFDYTLSGYGVLSDTRNGGLKRDLTAAYENPLVFTDLFPNLTQPPYIAMDMEKFADPAASDLRNNGYIHHGIFRDFYALKDRISGNSLPISVVDKRLFDNSAQLSTRLGTLGPHEINNLGHPYGQFSVWSGTSAAPTTSGAHNPITPVMAFLQQNAWIQAEGDAGDQNPPFVNYTQIWTGVYNPFNIRLDISARGAAGPMFRGYPMVRIYMLDGDDGSLVGVDKANPVDRKFNGRLLRPNRWIYTKEAVSLNPGQTQIFGFESMVRVSQTEGGRSHTFSKNIASSVQMASWQRRTILTAPGGTDATGNPTHVLPKLDMLVEMPLLNSQSDRGGSGVNDWNGASIGWGLPFDANSSNPGSHTGHELAQIFYIPFTSDLITDGTDKIEGVDVDKSNRSTGSAMGVSSPGVHFYREDIPFQQSRMSPIDEAVYEFKLRTTTETTSRGQIRPLIDSNIRAIWNNPKWDTGLGLNAIATHTFASNKLDDSEPASPDNLGQPQGNEAFLSYGNRLSDSGSREVILFDIPRDPLVSIGQLQHAAAGRFSYEPTYIVGNSYANIRIPLNGWLRTNASDTYSSQHNNLFKIPGNFNLYDASFLVNEALFDGYTFSTIPQTGGQAQLNEYVNGTQLLPNPRHLPYEPAGLSFTTFNLQSASSGRSNAGFVLVDGAFNVNSTSIEAWEVFLSGTKGLPFRKMNSDGSVSGFEPVDGVRFPRVQTILGEPWETTPNNAAWFGFRELTTAEVRELAEKLVELIKEHGPFYNLSEFINRPLVNA